MIIVDTDIMVDIMRGYPSAAENAPLCTFNRRHYSAIPKLRIIEPYKRIHGISD